jgi:hypothetical protein
MGFQDIWRYRSQVFGKKKPLLDALDHFLAGISVGLRREHHKPQVELVYRGKCVCLPQVWFVGVNGHELI